MNICSKEVNDIYVHIFLKKYLENIFYHISTDQLKMSDN